MTNKEASHKYDELAKKLATCILDIDDIHGTASYVSEMTGDNGDPKFILEEALEKLGVALANLLSYSKEYAEEAKQDADAKTTNCG